MNTLSIPRRFYLLDALRVLAIFRVLMWHWAHFSVTFEESGYIVSPDQVPLYDLLYIFYRPYQAAIPLFICISGFTFFWLYSARIADKSLMFGKFFIHRLSRLYPLHVLSLFAVLAGQIVYMHMTGKSFVYHYLDGWHFLLNLLMVSAWGLEKGFSFNGPAWLLSVMVFLYLVFFVFCRLLHRHFIALCLMMLAGFIIANNVTWAIGIGLGYFFFGGILFVFYQWLVKSGDPWRVSCWLPGMTVALWVLTLLWIHLFSGLTVDAFPALERFLSSYWAVGVLIPVTILSVTLYETCKGPCGEVFSFLSNNVYSIYLLHFPLQLLAVILAMRFNWPPSLFATVPFMLLFFSVLYGLAWVSHRFVEIPAQNYIRRRFQTSS